MAGFDPVQRRETWLFQLIRKDERGRPEYKRMQFNFVEYDGDPARYIEPVTEAGFVDAIAVQPAVIDPLTDVGRVVGFEFFEGRPYEVHSFNDNVGV